MYEVKRNKRSRSAKTYRVFGTTLLVALFFASNSLPGLVIADDAQPVVAGTNTTNTASNPDNDALQKELADIEAQIAAQEQIVAQMQGAKTTQQNILNQLKAEQRSLQLQIQATNLKISNLGNQIHQTEGSISDTEKKIDDLRPRLAEAIRQIDQQEQQSKIVVFFSSDNLSDAVSELSNLDGVSSNLTALAQSMHDLQSDLEQKQTVLEDQQDQSKNYLSIQALQAQQYQGKVSEQASVVSVAQAQVNQASSDLASKKARAQQIRNRLYNLAGGVTTNVSFGEAVDIAKRVSAQTGVRAAFLLAILTQESNLGQNVGTCNRAGDPPEKSYKVIMNPTRDIPKYLQIVEDLGMDPDTTPLSCPMRDKKGNRVGWGGAMGPAQFIPSTWMAHRDQVTAITGKTANPWDINDAFLASAILLAANGAAADGQQGEWNAAMRYFSGSTNTKYRFYGDNVLKIANQYQSDIAELSY